MVIADPTMIENQATPHCRALCDRFEAMFFHRDFATWNSADSAMVRTMRTLIPIATDRSMTAEFPWHSIMVLAFHQQAADQIEENYDVLFRIPIAEKTITTLMDEFDRIKPRNGDRHKQQMFETMVYESVMK